MISFKEYLNEISTSKIRDYLHKLEPNTKELHQKSLEAYAKGDKERVSN